LDSTITLNTSGSNLTRTGVQDPTKYDLLAVASHEIDEAIANGSNLNNLQNGDQHPATIEVDDLFRYDQTGARTYDTNLATQAFFSIDGGVTDLAQFNQTQGGDFSDWKTGAAPPKVQDANVTNGATANLGVELRLLDVLGYTRVTTLTAPVVTAPADQTAVEGASQTLNLGSFTTFTGDAGPFGVDMDWGDGSAHTTFFVASAGTLPMKSHTYVEEGSYTVKVTVTDYLSLSGSASYNVTVSDPAVVATGVAVSAAEGAAFTGTSLATFTDPGGPEALGDYSATIAWGDGSTSTGTISFDGSSTFTVSGAHTYGEEGTFTITTMIHHDSATPDASTSSTASVSDPAVVATGVPVSAVEGAAFTASIATFTDPGGPEPNPSDPSGTLANHYTIDSINWGDSTPLDTTSGTISFDGSTTFTVQGSHTYGEEGTYTTTAVLDHEGILTTVMATATVSDPAVVATPVPVFGVTCLSKTVTLATFTDPGGPEPNPSDPSGTLANHYKVASIDWGDATTLDTTSGTITFDGTGTFTVQGTHAYADEGVFTVIVILDHEGVLTTVTTTATIKDDIGLLLLDQTGSKSLMVTGNGVVDVTGCGVVVVDSSDASAAFVTGNGSVTAQDIDVTGGVKTAGHGSFSVAVEQEPATADPLGLPLPAPPSLTFAAVHYSGSAPLTLNPGTYVGGIKITGNGDVTLNPGVY
jgi:hypothetical protein